MGDFWEENIFKAVTQIRRYFVCAGAAGADKAGEAAQRSAAEHSGAEEGAEEGAEWRLYKLARWFLVGFGQCRP